MSGWIQPEKQVMKVLKSTVSLVKRSFADNSINRLLTNMYGDLPSRQKKMIKEWFKKNEINIIYGFPLDHEKLPCISIVVDPEEQVQQYIGDDYATDQISGERWRAQLCLICHAENMDLVRWIYHFAKYSLSTNRLRLSKIFQHAQESSGKDLEPERFGESGRIRYGRVLNFSVEYDQVAYKDHHDAGDWDDNNTETDDESVQLDEENPEDEWYEIEDYETIGKPC